MLAELASAGWLLFLAAFIPQLYALFVLLVKPAQLEKGHFYVSYIAVIGPIFAIVMFALGNFIGASILVFISIVIWLRWQAHKQSVE